MTPLPMQTWLNNSGRPVPQWPQRTSLLPQRIMPCYRSAPTEHISYSDNKRSLKYRGMQKGYKFYIDIEGS